MLWLIRAQMLINFRNVREDEGRNICTFLLLICTIFPIRSHFCIYLFDSLLVFFSLFSTLFIFFFPLCFDNFTNILPFSVLSIDFVTFPLISTSLNNSFTLLFINFHSFHSFRPTSPLIYTVTLCNFHLFRLISS